MGPEIVFILRLITPLIIFRYPLFGGALVFFLDAIDVIIIEIIGEGSFPKIDSIYNQYYHQIDKYLDTYYLTLEFLVSLRWSDKLAKKTSTILFIWRLIGFVGFEITKIRALLFLAPNLFENFYLFYLLIKKIYPKSQLITKKRLIIFLIILYIPKFFQELILHIFEWSPWTWYYENYFLKGKPF